MFCLARLCVKLVLILMKIEVMNTSRRRVCLTRELRESGPLTMVPRKSGYCATRRESTREDGDEAEASSRDESGEARRTVSYVEGEGGEEPAMSPQSVRPGI